MTYPLGVTAAGALAQAAWDRRPAAAGPYTITFPADAPAAFREQFGTYYANLGQTLTSVDLGPYNLFLNDGVYTITNLTTSGTVGLYPIAVGHGDNGGPATLTITTGTIDLQNSHNYGRLLVGSGSTLNLNSVGVFNASVTSIEGSGDVNIFQSYIKDLGLNPESDPAIHAEALHAESGNWTVRETFIRSQTGVNLLVHAEAVGGDVVWTVENSVLSVDTANNTGLYPIQVTPRSGNVTVIMNRVSIKKGTTGWLLVNTDPTFTGQVFGLATDVFDEDTGDDVSATINALFAGPPAATGGGSGGGTDTGDGGPTGGTSDGTGGGTTGSGDFFPPSTSGTEGSSTSVPPVSPPLKKTAKPHRKSLLSTISSAVQSFVVTFGGLLSGKRSSGR